MGCRGCHREWRAADLELKSSMRESHSDREREGVGDGFPGDVGGATERLIVPGDQTLMR